MITLRKASERGHANYGWLDTYYTFSFAGYHDESHMGFRSLRVLNDDRIDPGQGFGEHPHRNMEIVTYVLEGALAHKDSTGGGGVLRPGDVQRMSAGTGVVHSEFNHSNTEPIRLLQIWIEPDTMDIEPRYEQKTFAAQDKRGRLCLIASPDGRDGSFDVQQDVFVYATVLERGGKVSHDLTPGRHAWLQVARGDVEVNGTALREGDGVAFTEEKRLTLSATGEAELLLFDLA
jgi:redox-sensitive bicupin YhaK (pirin superfamily)